MSIQGFYNTTAIYEIPSYVTDEYGQEVKTWTVSTYILGTIQNRTGTKSIVSEQERLSISDRFYCDVVSIGSSGRLVFSTSAYSYQGTASTSTNLSSTEGGALYFISSSFSTYVAYDYAIYSSNSSAYIKNAMTYRNILNVNDKLRGSHLQVDLDIGYKNKT